MKLTFREKAKLFWERNKVDILGWLIGAGVITGIGCVGAHIVQKNQEKEARRIQERADRLMAELEEKEKEKEAEEARIRNDPANQIAGGYVDPSNDDLCDAEYPNILVNTVPIANMGELGQEVLNRLNTEWFGEFGETGEEVLFDPATATVDVMIDFGHEVWKRNHPEEAEESQEKQAS